MQVYEEIKKNVKKALPEILALRNTALKKPDGSYVTKGDLLVDQIVRETILDIDAFALLISEETYENKVVELQNYLQPLHYADHLPENIFVIDPIDGTENFTSGLPEWGVSISRYSGEGQHIESMLWCPEMDRYLDTKMQYKSAGTNSRIAGISSSMRLADLQKVTPGYEYRMFGCCVYSMLQTINGSFLSFENPKLTNSWDILAGLNLALAAGLSVKVNGYNYTGEYLPHTEKYSFRIDNAKLHS